MISGYLHKTTFNTFICLQYQCLTCHQLIWFILQLLIKNFKMGDGKLSFDQVNAMGYEEFTTVFGNVVEHCSLFAAAIWAQRPFSGVKHLHRTFTEFIDTLPELGKEGILRSHPDLAGRIAQQGLLTMESSKEQLAAGLNTLTPQEKTTLTDLNERYKSKFGFPFVICARENKKAAILSGLSSRLENSAQKEVTQGVEEVKKIAFYRLLDILEWKGDEGILK